MADSVRRADSGRVMLCVRVPSADSIPLGANVTATDSGRLVVHSVEPQSPAQRAGLQQGAEVVEAGGLPVRTADSFKRLVLSTRARRGSHFDITVKPAKASWDNEELARQQSMLTARTNSGQVTAMGTAQDFPGPAAPAGLAPRQLLAPDTDTSAQGPLVPVPRSVVEAAVERKMQAYRDAHAQHVAEPVRRAEGVSIPWRGLRTPNDAQRLARRFMADLRCRGRLQRSTERTPQEAAHHAAAILREMQLSGKLRLHMDDLGEQQHSAKHPQGHSLGLHSDFEAEHPPPVGAAPAPSRRWGALREELQELVARHSDLLGEMHRSSAGSELCGDSSVVSPGINVEDFVKRVQEVARCGRCGETSVADACFCHKCGTQLGADSSRAESGRGGAPEEVEGTPTAAEEQTPDGSHSRELDPGSPAAKHNTAIALPGDEVDLDDLLGDGAEGGGDPERSGTEPAGAEADGWENDDDGEEEEEQDKDEAAKVGDAEKGDKGKPSGASGAI